jgi:hypothetical protein
MLVAFRRYLYATRFLWMGHTWCPQKITVCHHISVKRAYLMPSKDSCIPSDSCEWGILYTFKRYLYAIILLWMGHTWCLQNIVVCHQIPVNGAYLMHSKDICMPSDLCEWCILDTFKRYMYAIIFLWMWHTWCLQNIVVCHQIPVNGAYLMIQKIYVCHQIHVNGANLIPSKNVYAIIFLWMGHTWYLHKIILTSYISFKS